MAVALAFTSGWAPAQTADPAPPQDPAKVAALQKRFEDGYALQQQGKLAEARAVYDGIIADEPHAKRSLLEAGRVSLKLHEYDKADAYLSRLHAQVPDFPEAIEMLIQANQALKRDVKVELLVRDFHTLHSTTTTDFGQSPKFVRERIPMPNGEELEISEFFTYKDKPNTVWSGKLLAADGHMRRLFELIYDPEATKEIRAKDPKYQNAEEFLLIEDVLGGDQIVEVDAYYQMFSLPEYKKARNTMLAIAAGAVKPIYSQKIDPNK